MSQRAAVHVISKERSLTSGPILPALVSFTLPVLAQNVLQSLNGSINAAWAGRLLGKTALAATANVNLIVFTVFALIFGFGMATTILIGQNMGRGDIPAVRRVVGVGVSLFAAIGLGVALCGWWLLPGILKLLSTPAEVYPQALAYARANFLGLPAGLVLVFLQMALRGVGDAKTPLLFVLPATVIDIALNPVLILGLGPAPKLGIAGSAAAAVIASFTTLALLIAYIYRRDLVIRLKGAELRYLVPSKALLGSTLRMGFPMGLQMIMSSAASLAMMLLVNRQGAAVVAAYGAANQLWTYIQMPAMAVSASVSTMVAQNIGARRWDRVDRITGAGLGINLALTSALVAVIAAGDHVFLGFFLGANASVLAIAQHMNLLVSWSFVLLGATMVLSAAPRANGVTIAPLLIMTAALIPGRLGVAHLLTPAIGPDAIWWSFPSGFAIAAALSAAYYMGGRWRRADLLRSLSSQESVEIAETEAEPTGRAHPGA